MISCQIFLIKVGLKSCCVVPEWSNIWNFWKKLLSLFFCLMIREAQSTRCTPSSCIDFQHMFPVTLVYIFSTTLILIFFMIQGDFDTICHVCAYIAHTVKKHTHTPPHTKKEHSVYSMDVNDHQYNMNQMGHSISYWGVSWTPFQIDGYSVPPTFTTWEPNQIDNKSLLYSI